MADLAARYWRTGRKVGRTVYAVMGDEASDTDPLIGVLDTVELARRAVMDHNIFVAWQRHRYDHELAVESRTKGKLEP